MDSMVAKWLTFGYQVVSNLLVFTKWSRSALLVVTKCSANGQGHQVITKSKNSVSKTGILCVFVIKMLLVAFTHFCQKSDKCLLLTQCHRWIALSTPARPSKLSFPKSRVKRSEVGLLPPEVLPNRGEAQTPQNSQIDDTLPPPLNHQDCTSHPIQYKKQNIIFVNHFLSSPECWSREPRRQHQPRQRTRPSASP